MTYLLSNVCSSLISTSQGGSDYLSRFYELNTSSTSAESYKTPLSLLGSRRRDFESQLP